MISLTDTLHHAWVDIINPPQVKYLAPLAKHLSNSGYSVVVTVRDYGSTVQLMQSSGVPFTVLGKSSYGVGRGRALTNLWRAYSLYKYLRSYGKVSFLLTGSRSASLAAYLMKVPDFAFCDYEFAELGSHRLLGSHLVFPNVIRRDVFEKAGFDNSYLISYKGIKEDITFSNQVDLSQESHIPLPTRFNKCKVALLRPPATASHYFNTESSKLYSLVLSELSGRRDFAVLFSPRYKGQQEDLSLFSWAVKPYVIDNTFDTVSLLNSVDYVISSGGTMVREAAYFNVKAISILAGKLCSVDAYLESRGLIRQVKTRGQIKDALFSDWGNTEPHPRNPSIISEIVQSVIHKVRETST